jgi:tRNA(Ile)-lysidine synthase
VSKLLKSVDQCLSGRGLLRRGQSGLVAVSGGVDSMVLLDLLHELSLKYSWQLTVAHLNHQLRGRRSDADEQLVFRTTRKLGLPFVSERANVKKLAKAQKLSIEMAARKVRHEFLARTAKRLGIRTVALAHHADDQLELFFLRLLRGSGSEGLAGMKWRSPSPAIPKVELIRPLLEQPKAALLSYAQERKIRFHEDATNASMSFQRNRIRHELLPLIRKEYQPGLERSISRVMEILGAEGDFVDQAAKKWLEQTHPTAFEKLPVALQRRCLQLQLFDLGVAGDFDLIETLRGGESERGGMIASQSLVVRDKQGRLALRKINPLRSDDSCMEVGLIETAGEVSFKELEVSWRISNAKSLKLPMPKSGQEVFDADKVGSTIVLRHWRSGDRFQPIGMPRPVKLQDLFTNQKIPREERHRLVVAATHSGELFWVEKLRISETFKVTGQTIRRLLWVWKRS